MLRKLRKKVLFTAKELDYFLGNKRGRKYYIEKNYDVKGFTYGAVASAEVEIAIWKRLSGVVSFSEYFYPKDKWIRWNYGVKAGFKVYL